MWFIPHVRWATAERIKSHNHELKADKWLNFTLARIPQGMQKYIEKKKASTILSFVFQLYAGTGGIHKFLRLSNYVSLSKLHLLRICYS